MQTVRITSTFRRRVDAREAVALFVAWMRDWEFHGWHCADDVDEFYRWHCAEEGVEEVDYDQMRAGLAVAPGCVRQRRRMMCGEMRRVREYLTRLGREVGEKEMLYRIASHEEMEAAAVRVREATADLARRRSEKRRHAVGEAAAAGARDGARMRRAA